MQTPHQRNSTLYPEQENVDYVTCGGCRRCDSEGFIASDVGFCILFEEQVNTDEKTDCDEWQER